MDITLFGLQVHDGCLDGDLLDIAPTCKFTSPVVRCWRQHQIRLSDGLTPLAVNLSSVIARRQSVIL